MLWTVIGLFKDMKFRNYLLSVMQNVIITTLWERVIPCLSSLCFDVMHGRCASYFVNRRPIECNIALHLIWLSTISLPNSISNTILSYSDTSKIRCLVYYQPPSKEIMHFVASVCLSVHLSVCLACPA